VQVPFVVAPSQASHVPAQASLQQTPSAQNPLAQSPAAAQTAPKALRFAQTPTSQNPSAAQSVFVVQAEMHAPERQRAGEQSLPATTAQAPAPSHAWFDALPAQVEPHDAPAG
jgi:hypothetical protein